MRQNSSPATPPAPERATGPAHDDKPPAPFADAIGRTRYVVLVAVAAVLLVAVGLFLFGAIQALVAFGHGIEAVLRGDFRSTELTVEFLEIVSVMLKAVVFYLIGVGFYSLFIAPLNVTEALGVDTFHDLETRIVNVVIVIMAVTLLEHFIQWQQPLETLMFGGTFGIVVATLVLFQFYNQKSKKQEHQSRQPEEAQRAMFEQGEEKLDLPRDPAARDGGEDSRESVAPASPVKRP